MKILALFKYIFSLLGLALLLVALWAYQNTTSFLEKAERAEGTVIEMVRGTRTRSSYDDGDRGHFQSEFSTTHTYRPVVRFMDSSQQEREFASAVSSSPPQYAKGDKVQVLYSPDNPQEAKIHSIFALWGVSIFLAGGGLLFLLVGVGFGIGVALWGKTNEHLKQQGLPATSTIVSVAIVHKIRINGKNPWQIVSEWQNPATSEVHRFQSRYLMVDPSDHIKSQSVTVYMDSKNRKNYYMDLEFLPKG